MRLEQRSLPCDAAFDQHASVPRSPTERSEHYVVHVPSGTGVLGVRISMPMLRGQDENVTVDKAV